MKANQKGFSVVEVVIVLVVVGLIGGVGFMVYKNHNKKAVTNSAATTTSTKPTTTETKPATKADPYAGWKSFTSNAGGFSLKYPADWTITDNTAGSNEEQAFLLQSPDKDYGSVLLAFDVLNKTQEGTLPQYTVDSSVQNLSNGFRIWTDKMKWSSKSYNNNQEFDCARLRFLDKSANSDVTLANSKYLSSQGGFCMNQNSYTTKSYQEQLTSQEIQDSLKIYTSLAQ
jgi:prepilin-type N-terminal cleavage/methylation domain-containing protein